jgi:bifunctional NMN adenylyltransferase/nudix hydrolase
VAWSQLLDDAIHLIAPIGQISLYGGRDSFVKHYSGKHQTVELDAFEWVTGTDIREDVGRTPLTSEEARKGVIYLAENQYPRVNQVVDIAILRNEGDSRQVLLGQRQDDRDSSLNWRFPGGFVNADDPSLEAACRRESAEETNIMAESPEYLCSMPIGDSRMKGGDIIMTAFFKAEYVMGSPKGGDDLGRVAWFDIQKLPKGYMYPNHLPLLEALIASELG